MSEVEVLRFVLCSIADSTRTAAGGDILDAVYFFLQNPLVHILPESRNSSPVKLECGMSTPAGPCDDSGGGGGGSQRPRECQLYISAKVTM